MAINSQIITNSENKKIENNEERIKSSQVESVNFYRKRILNFYNDFSLILGSHYFEAFEDFIIENFKEENGLLFLCKILDKFRSEEKFNQNYANILFETINQAIQARNSDQELEKNSSNKKKENSFSLQLDHSISNENFNLNFHDEFYNKIIKIDDWIEVKIFLHHQMMKKIMKLKKKKFICIQIMLCRKYIII